MLYGEIGSSSVSPNLQSSSDPSVAVRDEEELATRDDQFDRRFHTFEDGSSLAGEYLHDGHGYTSAQEDAYFAAPRHRRRTSAWRSVATAPVRARLPARRLAEQRDGRTRLLAPDVPHSLTDHGDETLRVRRNRALAARHRFRDGGAAARRYTPGVRQSVPATASPSA